MLVGFTHDKMLNLIVETVFALRCFKGIDLVEVFSTHRMCLIVNSYQTF